MQPDDNRRRQSDEAPIAKVSAPDGRLNSGLDAYYVCTPLIRIVLVVDPAVNVELTAMEDQLSANGLPSRYVSLLLLLFKVVVYVVELGPMEMPRLVEQLVVEMRLIPPEVCSRRREPTVGRIHKRTALLGGSISGKS